MLQGDLCNSLIKPFWFNAFKVDLKGESNRYTIMYTLEHLRSETVCYCTEKEKVVFGCSDKDVSYVRPFFLLGEAKCGECNT